MSDKINGVGATEPMWEVTDSNARLGPRTHEAAPGSFYELHASKRTAMPRKHAAIFLRDPAFKVYNEFGQVQSPLPDLDTLRQSKGQVTIKEGQTIASFEELTIEALFARCVARPGGYEVDPADRTAMVEFLKTAPTVVEVPRSERARDVTTDGDPDQMPDDAVAKMLGADGAVARAASAPPQRDPLTMGA